MRGKCRVCVFCQEIHIRRRLPNCPFISSHFTLSSPGASAACLDQTENCREEVHLLRVSQRVPQPHKALENTQHVVMLYQAEYSIVFCCSPWTTSNYIFYWWYKVPLILSSYLEKLNVKIVFKLLMSNSNFKGCYQTIHKRYKIF